MDVEDFFTRLRNKGELTPALREEIIRMFGDRGRKALKAIDEHRIKKYLDFYIVVGTSGEYIVEDEFCTCPVYFYRGGGCWHVLAVKIAALSGDYESYDLWYQDCWNAGSPTCKQYLS
ncbi:MAG TPA: SWIM zinc finger family protein [Methanoregulaceae archaeon]|nr:MAG: SWIM zinc finger family protein [Methanolinea sp.]HON81098.1 SWIM zinc finger family protein [Methanoregulaceae archaeon]HPD09958.1 SWIM zinc finger family protein [Methanoregulaceae archaeon]HRT14851.1 SWIM zinc finger family protein [Methanoregulaceae archaeon]HRU30534.1 SWIM zinc finger family protein [Methanoregulaceae archaeon]